MTENHLREARIEAGISQLELARQTRISPGDLCCLERGRKYPYPGWRSRIAEVLKKPEGEIFPSE